MWSGLSARSRVVPLWPGWPPLGLSDLRRRLRVRFLRGPLFFFRLSLAGGLELVELSSAALECGNPFAQVDILALQRVDPLDQPRSGAADPDPIPGSP